MPPPQLLEGEESCRRRGRHGRIYQRKGVHRHCERKGAPPPVVGTGRVAGPRMGCAAAAAAGRGRTCHHRWSGKEGGATAAPIGQGGNTAATTMGGRRARRVTTRSSSGGGLLPPPVGRHAERHWSSTVETVAVSSIGIHMGEEREMRGSG